MAHIPSRSSSVARHSGKPVPNRSTLDVLVDGVWYNNQPVAPSRTPSVTPSITPSITITPSVTRTPSVTPSVTPSITPSVTPSPSRP